jgi:carbonic anhydrase
VEDVSRRNALRGMALTVGALASASVTGGLLGVTDAFAAETPTPTSLTPEQAVKRLAAGNRRFVNDNLKHPRRDSRRRIAVAEGQAPFAVVLGCADSRVPPEVVYDEGLGNLFVVRIAGNTAVDAFVLGSVEYGTAELGAVAIVVLGHESCGAVKAAIDVAQNGTELPGDIGAFVAPIVPIAEELIPKTPKNKLVEAVTLANIRNAVSNLQQNELLSQSISAGKLEVIGGEYQTKTGKVLVA